MALMLRSFARPKSLTAFKLCATTPNNTQRRGTGCAEGTQHVTSNNVGSCWPTTFASVWPGRMKCYTFYLGVHTLLAYRYYLPIRPSAALQRACSLVYKNPLLWKVREFAFESRAVGCGFLSVFCLRHRDFNVNDIEYSLTVAVCEEAA